MLNVSKSLGVIVLSAGLGGIVGAFITSITPEPYTGGGALSTPNFDRTLEVIVGCIFGAIEGFLFTIITLSLLKKGRFSRLTVLQALSLITIYGLISSLPFAAFAFYVSIEGGGTIDNGSMKRISKTAVTELITGCLIGGISVLLVKFFSTSSTAENEPLK